MINLKLLKITNWIIPGLGTADYKGLDIDLFVPGTQVYPDDTICYIGTEQEDIPQHADIEEITQEQYNDVIAALPGPGGLPDPLQEIRDRQALMEKALEELILGGM